VPSHVVVLPTLPSTANGKVDRQALPAPDWSRVDRPGPLVEPRAPIEKELAAIWADVLGLEAVGVTDSFLDLGGHSLLASRIAARVLDRFQASLSAADLLRAPTVEAMAVLVIAALMARADSPVDAIMEGLDSPGTV
jgi:hypothetical protein